MMLNAIQLEALATPQKHNSKRMQVHDPMLIMLKSMKYCQGAEKIIGLPVLFKASRKSANCLKSCVLSLGPEELWQLSFKRHMSDGIWSEAIKMFGAPMIQNFKVNE